MDTSSWVTLNNVGIAVASTIGKYVGGFYNKFKCYIPWSFIQNIILTLGIVCIYIAYNIGYNTNLALVAVFLQLIITIRDGAAVTFYSIQMGNELPKQNLFKAGRVFNYSILIGIAFGNAIAIPINSLIKQLILRIK